MLFRRMILRKSSPRQKSSDCNLRCFSCYVPEAQQEAASGAGASAGASAKSDSGEEVVDADYEIVDDGKN
jgi:hypothetical protein